MAVEALLISYNGEVQKPAPVLVMVTSTLPGRLGDGTPEFVLDLARAVTGFRVVIVAPRVRGGALRETIDGVEIRRIAYAPQRWERLADDAMLPTLTRSPWLVWQVPSLLAGLTWTTLRSVRETQPRAVDAHWIIPGGVIAWLIRCLTRVPYVVNVHGADAYALNGRIARRLKRLVLRGAVVVLPVSSEIAERVSGEGIEVGPILPMGVDSPRLRGGLGARRPVAGRLLFVGRLAQKKGADVLLRALVSVPDADLVIVGDGPERSSLETLARTLGLENRVDFLGHGTRSMVLEQLAAAAAVVIPSRRSADGDQDGTPVVMMEAMACGVPVIASALGGISEQLDDERTGLLVPQEDPERLASAIERVLHDPEAAERLAANARSYADEHLDVGALASRFERAVGEATASEVP